MPMKRARSEAPAPPQTVNYVTYNITNYFAAAPAPAAPPEEGPARLFQTNADRLKRVSVVKHGKPCSVYVWYSASDGTIKGGCHGMCRKQFVDLANFAPADGSSNTQADRTKFDAAYAAYKAAHAAGDRDACVAQRGVLESLRSKTCFTCRHDPGYLTPTERACKEWYDGVRKAMAAQNDGCAHQDCPERGPEVWCILTAEHGTNPKKRDAKGKPVSLSSYCRWGALGGVPAMIEEAKQIEKWTCRCCAAVDPSSNQANRCADPAGMPPGKCSGTDAEVQQYDARHKAVRVYPKQQHVDAAKRRVGECAACARPVVAGQEVMFDWDHRDESTKCKGGLFGKCGGVSGLVGNCANAATLDQVRHLLDAEMAKCDLLCRNCHARRTWKYAPSATAF
jgi:hypothetical protein